MSAMNIQTFALAIASTVTLWAADSTLLRLIPPDTELVASIDIDRMKSSPSWPFLLSAASSRFGGLHEFVGSGYDNGIQIHQVVLMMQGENDELVILRGFADDRHLTRLDRPWKDKTQRTLKNARVLVAAAEDEEGVTIWTAALSGWIVIGPAAKVEAALDRVAHNVAVPSELEKQVSRAENEFDAWTILLHRPKWMDIGSLGLAVNLHQARFGVRLGAIASLSGEAAFANALEATAVSALAKTAIEQAQAEYPKPELANLLPRLSFSTSGERAILQWVLSGEEFERLLTAWPPGGFAVY